MPSYPLATLAAQVSSAGISAPSYNDIWESLKATYRSIFGSDSYLETDSQDGQLLAIFALAISDLNQTGIAIYNSQSPAFAQGAGLSRVVKINGLTRQTSAQSTVELTIGGVVGTVIINGRVQDASRNIWDLPASVIIPPAGFIVVTATAETPGNITATPNQVNIIFTPVRGWQTVTNAADATPGHDVESDAALRRRQAVSVGLPSQTRLASIAGAVSNLAGVGRYAIYENQGTSTDDKGIPGHSISLIVEGGDDNAIASVINSKKSPGTGTYGTTSVLVSDVVPITINFFRPTVVEIQVAITVKRLTGFQAPTTDSITSSLCDFISGQSIGEDVHESWLYGAAGLNGNTTFDIQDLTFSRVGGVLGTSDVSLNVNEVAHCNPSNITVTVI
jgi:uncharacterized phage protein gp47/JayE